MTATLDFILNHPLTRDRPIRSLARYAAWQLGSRLVRDHGHPWIDGACLMVRNGMTGATGNIYCGLHEFVDMAFVLHLLRPGDLFLDIGANVGSYSVLAAAVCRAEVLAFEPDPDTLVHLRRNVAANAVDDRVVVHDVALGAEVGEATFTVGLDSMNQVVVTAGGPTRRVRMLPLDAVPRSSEAALMKLDVEGFEAQVLAGAARALASPTLLAVEPEGRGQAITTILSAHGFVETTYNPFTRRLGGPAAFTSSNALFVRDVEAVQARVRAAAAHPRPHPLGRARTRSSSTNSPGTPVRCDFRSRRCIRPHKPRMAHRRGRLTGSTSQLTTMSGSPLPSQDARQTTAMRYKDFNNASAACLATQRSNCRVPELSPYACSRRNVTSAANKPGIRDFIW